MTTLSPEAKKLLSDKAWRLRNLYKIIDKQGNLVRFTPNKEQDVLIDAYLKKREKGELLREFQLKDRKIGITTFHCLWYFDDVCWTDNITAGIIAHERDKVEKIFRIVKVAWENMPAMYRPSARIENKNELFLEDTNSTIYIALTARSGTLHRLHVSEVAYIKDVKELRSGTFQAAKAGDITCETTANGLNHFYQTWTEPSQVWSKHFFSWLDHTEYVLKTPYLGNKKYEEYLAKIGASEEQRNWWYYTLDEMSGDFDLMRQEYPANAEEAFIRSSRSVFGDIIDVPKVIEPIREIAEAHYQISIFEEPDREAQYRLGADTSGGYSDGDYSCFYILNARTRKIALEWHGHEAPDRFGYRIEEWARKYNDAECAIEANNHGLTTITAIKDSYSNLYQRERRNTVDNTVTQELGWLTTSKSKDELIDEIKTNLRDGSVGEIPKGLKSELTTFMRKDNGDVGAEVGCFDDRVMGFGIALMMVKSSPFYKLEQKVGKYMGR